LTGAPVSGKDLVITAENYCKVLLIERMFQSKTGERIRGYEYFDDAETVFIISHARHDRSGPAATGTMPGNA